MLVILVRKNGILIRGEFPGWHDPIVQVYNLSLVGIVGLFTIINSFFSYRLFIVENTNSGWRKYLKFILVIIFYLILSLQTFKEYPGEVFI